MPKSTKDVLKRQLGQAGVNLNYSGSYISGLADTFRPVHPELAEILDIAMEGLVNVENLLKVFSDQAWGNPDPEWTIYAGTNRPRHDESLAEPNQGEPEPEEG